jgi:hypothetical protein
MCEGTDSLLNTTVRVCKLFVLSIQLGYQDSKFKVEVKSVLRIGSAHNNVRTSNVNIAQISNVSNFSEHKLYFIFI